VLQRALWNLVTNAVKYGAPKEPITLAVSCHGDLARVSVHNMGTPIPVNEQCHIFDAYARAPSAEAGGRTGWGLGLTLVRDTADAHGGRVSLASDSRSGTTFTIELPVDSRSVDSRSVHVESERIFDRALTCERLGGFGSKPAARELQRSSETCHRVFSSQMTTPNC
jgi:K+-sensing histidine kinase KdpD